MLKKKISVLILVFSVLMVFCGCAPSLPAESEENSAIIKPGTTYIGAKAIFSGSLFGFCGPTYTRYEITEDSVVCKYSVYSEEKVLPVEKWEWQEFPYSEEEWNELFLVPEEIFDIFQYGKIMYQPITELSSFLLVDGEIWCMNITPVNDENHPFLVHSIELLLPEDSIGKALFEYAPAMSSKEPFFDFEMRVDFSRISASGGEGRLVDVDKPYFQLGHNIVIDDHDFIRWSPADYDGNIAAGCEINFAIFQNGDNTSWVYDGKIIIEKIKSENGKTLYEATLISPDLLMKTDENTGRIYIFDPDTYLGDDEETGESRNFWDFVPFG
ncbi:MAG: hypothetical protein IKL57_08385 [Oscillospiraceae bacterium]|nr:hypothetical protein [Oscillospiraceae bacterium]